VRFRTPRNESRAQGDLNNISWLDFDSQGPRDLGLPLATIPEETSNVCECAQLRQEISELREEFSLLQAQVNSDSNSLPALAQHVCTLSQWLHQATGTHADGGDELHNSRGHRNADDDEWRDDEGDLLL